MLKVIFLLLMSGGLPVAIAMAGSALLYILWTNWQGTGTVDFAAAGLVLNVSVEDTGGFQNAERGAPSDSEDVGQSHLHPLVQRKINTCDTCHSDPCSWLLALGKYRILYH